MNVLLVEDDPQILELLKAYFETKGYGVSAVDDGVEALEHFRNAEPDLMLLDIGLPRLDGWSVLEAVRATSKVPVIVLTAHDESEDAVRGLSLGADDYLRKPFDIRELDARIGAVLRRAAGPPLAELLEVGAIQIDNRAKQVTLSGEPVTLSPKEYELLRLLASDPGRVFSNDEIIAHLWPDSDRADASDVKQYVHLLRGKLVCNHGTRECIQTVKGFGYKVVT
ncbi:MAG: response regulator transcription factor [Acidiferrobacterales bacterium]